MRPNELVIHCVFTSRPGLGAHNACTLISVVEQVRLNMASRVLGKWSKAQQAYLVRGVFAGAALHTVPDALQPLEVTAVHITQFYPPIEGNSSIFGNMPSPALPPTLLFTPPTFLYHLPIDVQVRHQRLTGFVDSDWSLDFGLDASTLGLSSEQRGDCIGGRCSSEP